MKHNIEDLLELAKKAALEAYEELLRLNESQVLEFSFSNDLPREMKSLADQVIEKVILRKLFQLQARWEVLMTTLVEALIFTEHLKQL